jgi:ATP-binding protein involved in chromosome partitioning
MALTENDVLAALRTVIDPELGRDLVAAGMVKSTAIEGPRVQLVIELTTPACPQKDKIEADIRAALAAVSGLASLDLTFTARVRSAITNRPESDLVPQVKNVILVGAGKGGVGKSTVAVNLAAALARCGATVGLLDADFYGPSIPIMTGLMNAHPHSRDGKTMEPLEAHGLRIMSIGFLVDPDQALVWRGPMLHGALIQLLRDVRWGELDYLVLDLPPGTGDIPLTLAQQVRAAGVVLVTTPQDVSLSDVIKAKLMFDKVHIPVLGIIENMSSFACPHCGQSTDIFASGGGEKAASQMRIPFLGRVPIDLAIREGGDEGVPIVVGKPDSPQSAALVELAKRVAGEVSSRTEGMKLPIFKTGS